MTTPRQNAGDRKLGPGGSGPSSPAQLTAPMDLGQRLQAVMPYLDEWQRRLLLGMEADRLGSGGITAVAAASQVSRATVARGLKEARTAVGRPGASLSRCRTRRSGAGRRRAEEADSGLLEALAHLVDGPSDAVLSWAPSTRVLAERLEQQDHPVSDRIIARLLTQLGFRLPCPASVAGRRHRNQAEEFESVNARATAHLAAGWPGVALLVARHEGGDADVGSGRRPARANGLSAELMAATVQRCWREVGEGPLLVCVGFAHRDAEPMFDAAWDEAIRRLDTAVRASLRHCYVPAGTIRWNHVSGRYRENIEISQNGRTIQHTIAVDHLSPPSGIAETNVTKESFASRCARLRG